MQSMMLSTQTHPVHTLLPLVARALSARQFASSALTFQQQQSQSPHTYTTPHDEIVRVEGESEGGALVLTLALADAALDRMGDPTRIEAPSPSADVAAGEEVCSIHWTGFMQSEADELYHSVWQESHGRRALRLPFAASLLEVNPHVAGQPGCILGPEPSPWLVRVRAAGADVWRAVLSGELAPVWGSGASQQRL